MYLKNAWYVAGWSSEIGRELLERTICEQSIVLYRKENGDPVAIGNMCPHRFAPLSAGKLVGDDLQCGYHGLRFGAQGKCVLNPHAADGVIPAKMRVRSYPVVERYDMIWLWMGDEAKTDPAMIPDFSCNTAEGFVRIGGMFEVKANYELITDNILDLTHADFLHEGILSSKAMTDAKLETLQVGTTVWSNRWAPDGEAAPAWKMAFDNYDKNVDHWGYTRWDAPAHLLLDVGVSPVGRPRGEGMWLYGTDIFTPKDKKNTYYFWAFARNYRTDDRAVDEFWRQAIQIAFGEQDIPMLEKQQAMMGDRELDEIGPVMIAADISATRARRVLRQLIADEEKGVQAVSSGRSLLDLLKERGESAWPVLPVV